MSATLPPEDQRREAVMLTAPHPAVLPTDGLAQQIEKRFQRRSGPGGQHRNKTSSGVFLCHTPTGVVAEATERRSQADNRSMAMSRLRFRLAIEVRTPSLFDQPQSEEMESQIRSRYHASPLKLNDTNQDKPAVLALLLNDLHAAGGQPSLVSPVWKSSTSSLVLLVKSQPEAFVLVNAIRAHHGRRSLR